MRTSRARHLLAALFLTVVGVVVAGPAGAVEDGLMGARIGASYREVLRKFRQPNGMLIAAPTLKLTKTTPAGGVD